jgi:uncharacterized protein involved in exopolysaccharide biosynthesis
MCAKKKGAKRGFLTVIAVILGLILACLLADVYHSVHYQRNRPVTD